MPRLSIEDRERIRASNPDAFILRTNAAQGHDLVFRAARLAEFDAFLSSVNGDTQAKTYAHRTLAADCVVFPERAAFLAFAKEFPGAAHAFGDELARRAGLQAEVQSEAL